MVLSLYELAWRPAAVLIGRTDPQVAHARTVRLMRGADSLAPAESLARLTRRLASSPRPVQVGGVKLPGPVVVAAGLVKGDGFDDEPAALRSVEAGRNVVPGWRSVPALVGAVEFGSYTRQPRQGNRGRVLWRDSATRSMQNRVGLRNPGARAAAAYLGRHANALPKVWGVSLAVSPGIDDIEQRVRELSEAVGFFEAAFADGVGGPSWCTLNLSCPNTEDDPLGRQTESEAQALCAAIAERSSLPLWVKVGPDLSAEQLAILVDVFDAAGVRAIVATNTAPHAVPGTDASAGLSGARLRPQALQTVRSLTAMIAGSGSDLDVVASGGILNGSDLLAFTAAGARAAMVYSALVFRGPLAPALIAREAERGGRLD